MSQRTELNSLDKKLQRKLQLFEQLKIEINELQEKINAVREANILKAMREVNLAGTEYGMLEKAIKNGTVKEFLQSKYELERREKE